MEAFQEIYIIIGSLEQRTPQAKFWPKLFSVEKTNSANKSFGRNKIRPKVFRPKTFSADALAIRIAQGGRNEDVAWGGSLPLSVRTFNLPFRTLLRSQDYRGAIH